MARRFGATLAFDSFRSPSPRDLAPAALAREYAPRLEHNLLECIIAFWMPRCLDESHGGYRISFDPTGLPIDGATKGLVSQSRLLWLFSRLCRTSYAHAEHLKIATHGFDFIREHFADAKHGGFHWEVDAAGAHKIGSDKHLYGQAFAVHALSEYALASASTQALTLADQCVHLLESHGRDAQHGGYFESLDRTWRRHSSDTRSYLGVPATLKTMNTHLHLLEAYTAYLRAHLALASSPAFERRLRERLYELMEILSSAVLIDCVDACMDRFHPDWSPFEPGRAVISYGHDLENAWLLLDTCDALGDAARKAALAPRMQRIFENSLRYGYDRVRGGFFESGRPGRRAHGRDKIWWVQAESLVCCLRLYTLTADPRCLSTFAGTYDFIERHLIDTRYGEWHERVRRGRPTNRNKGHHWKAGYHNGRSMIECLSVLDAFGRGSYS